MLKERAQATRWIGGIATTLSLVLMSGCGSSRNDSSQTPQKNVPAGSKKGNSLATEGTPTDVFNFSVSKTNGARTNTRNQSIVLNQGDTLDLGTCGLPSASFTGDTVIRLFDDQGTQLQESDDACGGHGSLITYVADRAMTVEARVGCFANSTCGGTVSVVIESLQVTKPDDAPDNAHVFVSNTDSAQRNTQNADIAVQAGQTVTVGTCGITGAHFNGDTYMRLFNGRGLQLAQNDDACNGLGSQIVYTAQNADTLQVRTGCFENTSCEFTVASTVNDETPTSGKQPAPPSPTNPNENSLEFSVSNTQSATRNTQRVDFEVRGGETLVVGTCGLHGANFNGDTYLRVFDQNGNQVAENDDACNGRGSFIQFTPAESTTLQASIGCFENENCNGRLVWHVEDLGYEPTIPVGPEPPERPVEPNPPIDPIPPQTEFGSFSFSFSASNTGHAQQNTVNRVLEVSAGETVTIGTCDVGNARYEGDPIVRVFDFDQNVEVAQSDDDCGRDGLGSWVRLTALGDGRLEFRVGCFENTACSGLAEVEVTEAGVTPDPGPNPDPDPNPNPNPDPSPTPVDPRPLSGTFDFQVFNTNNAQNNTEEESVILHAGETLVAGTCGLSGADFTGDTIIRILDSNESELVSNDDSCGGSGSYVTYTASQDEEVEIAVGCFQNESCDGMVAWQIQ